jgi:hypothetical protein
MSGQEKRSSLFFQRFNAVDQKKTPRANIKKFLVTYE